jgi:hypothetical protein
MGLRHAGDRVVNIQGKRPVKIEGGFPNECACWATW